MKKADASSGFLLCFLMNLLFRSGWLVFIVVLVVLYFALAWPWWLFFIPLGVWILHALLITILVFAGNKAGNSSSPVVKSNTQNVNPYSKKNSDYKGYQ